MSYSGAEQAKTARESLSNALAALQEDANLPESVTAVTEHIAKAVGALFEAERASSEPDGKSCVKSALGLVSQTLALLQDTKTESESVGKATEGLAAAMGALFPLTQQPSRLPPADGRLSSPPTAGSNAPAPKAASEAPAAKASLKPAAKDASKPAKVIKQGPRNNIEVNIGATTESNFYVGFSGEISEGGVFAATYNIFPKGTLMQLLITLPGGFERSVTGEVKFVRDPMDFAAESDPGMGIAFDELDPEGRELILRFIRKRPPLFWDE